MSILLAEVIVILSVGRHTGFQEPNGKQFTKLRLGYSGYHDYVCVCVDTEMTAMSSPVLCSRK